MRVNRRQFDKIASAISEARFLGTLDQNLDPLTHKRINHIEDGVVAAFQDVDANFNATIFREKCRGQQS